MPRPSPEALALAARYRFAVGTTQRGGSPGERLGRAAGSSLEYEDRRAYSVGDDVRHLDWRAYARTDTPMVQIFREEITPRLELLLDLSASMAVDEAKAQLALDLTGLLGEAARAEGFSVRTVLLGEGMREVSREEFAREELAFDALTPPVETVRGARSALRAGSVRLLVSDFLFPDGTTRLARDLAAGAGRLVFVQVLAAFDRHPPADEALRLVDAEDGTYQDLVLDGPTLRTYRERLERHLTSVRDAVHAAGGAHALVSGDEGLEDACSTTLCRAGVLAPA